MIKYESTLKVHRLDIINNSINEILLNTKDRNFLENFWIHFTSYGYYMTNKVEEWIKRSAESCISLGFKNLGQNLKMHAEHEAGHEKMMLLDCKRLIENLGYSPKFIDKAPVHVIPYVNLHEDLIKTCPYGQIAVEYEIEMLTLTLGDPVLKHTASVLGSEFAESLSFLKEHVVLDVGHTKFNQEQLRSFIEEHPTKLDDLINSGIRALHSYNLYLVWNICQSRDKKNVFEVPMEYSKI